MARDVHDLQGGKNSQQIRNKNMESKSLKCQLLTEHFDCREVSEVEQPFKNNFCHPVLMFCSDISLSHPVPKDALGQGCCSSVGSAEQQDRNPRGSWWPWGTHCHQQRAELSTNPERFVLLSPWAAHCHRISEWTGLGKEFREIPMVWFHQWPWIARTHQQPPDEEIPVLELTRSWENIQDAALSLSFILWHFPQSLLVSVRGSRADPVWPFHPFARG